MNAKGKEKEKKKSSRRRHQDDEAAPKSPYPSRVAETCSATGKSPVAVLLLLHHSDVLVSQGVAATAGATETKGRIQAGWRPPVIDQEFGASQNLVFTNGE
jgi:hypothetical protein